MTNTSSAIIFLLFMTFLSAGWAAEGSGDLTEDSSQSDWHFNANVTYSSRTLSGTVANKTAISNDVFGDLIVTGDSMNVGSSDGMMLALGAQYKKWGLGLNYMPTSFSGQGSALAVLDGENVDRMVKTPLRTDIDVNMLLANGFYNFIQTKNTVFGVGFGFGQTSIDLNIIPEIGNSIIYDGQQPFGFLNLHMSNTYQKFMYGFSLNGVSASFNGVAVDYSDYKVDLGYRLMDKNIKVDLVTGYRLVNFAVDIENGLDVVKASVALQGSFLGVNVVF